MWLERISGGGAPLIDLDDAKRYLRIDGDEFDAEIGSAVASASSHLDVDASGFGGLGFPLVAQQWSSKAAGFTSSALRLPFTHVTSVDEIRIVAADGANGIALSNSYDLIRRGRHSAIALKSGASWPPVADHPAAVDIRFTAGFPTIETVPEDIKSAVRVLTELFFDARGDNEMAKSSAKVMNAVDRLTARYRSFAI